MLVKAISIINGTLWNISKVNERIYDTIVKNIIRYGSKVWQKKERTEKMLPAIEIGDGMQEKIINKRIRDTIGSKLTIVKILELNN